MPEETGAPLATTIGMTLRGALPLIRATIKPGCGSISASRAAMTACQVPPARRAPPARPAHVHQLTVDSVTTLAPFQPATVVATFDGTFVRFAFGIPQRPPGTLGNNGLDGSPGMQGPQGPAGEVTAAQLATAIAGTPSNTNPITTLDIPISNPPTQGEITQCWRS